MGVFRAGTVLQLLVSLQANYPPAVSTTEAARICVCSPTKAMSTVPVEGAGSSRRISPAGVRKLAEAGAEAARETLLPKLDSGWTPTHGTLSTLSYELFLSGAR